MKSRAYLAGVLNGDGYIAKVFGLNVKDKDFAEAFSKALKDGFNVTVEPKQDKRGIWVVRKGSRTGKFDFLRSYEPQGTEEKASWLRGLFDSEGNATLRKNGISQNSYGRRVAIYSSNLETLERAKRYLLDLFIPTNRIRLTKNSNGHKGTKLIYELTISGGRENYINFSRIVGSSIHRKQEILDAIPSSYKPDISQHCREIQKIGAETKHKNTMTVTLPFVIQEVNKMIQKGVKPTQRACRAIPGYNSIQRYISQSELIAMAEKL